ncbi:uncharacterized protein LOC103043678 [Astyanax mexicanus]|uniref:uncharacterized protein LOC103043678 n=1 Tax=Astyanax mexicanus TaxID=7994 RepID=UPI0020CACBB1|nr:uncharacterized protein LOC103043678 [Astyanax mexicanus]
MKMLLICGVLLMFTGSAVGLITVGPQCRSDQTCVFYEALEHPMHLQLPSESELTLKKIDERVSQVILKCKKQKILIHLNYPRWQFVSEHRTMIITRAEKNDSGRYRLETFDSEGTNKGVYDFHLTIEAVVSSVEVKYSCLSGLNRRLFCSSDGDQIHFSWTFSRTPFKQRLTDGNKTLLLDKDEVVKVTCHVENHVSRGNKTIELHQCPGSSSTVGISATESPVSPAFPESKCTNCDSGLMVFVSVWLFEVIILVSLLVGAFYIYTRIYRKQRAAESKQQEGEEPL